MPPPSFPILPTSSSSRGIRRCLRSAGSASSGSSTSSVRPRRQPPAGRPEPRQRALRPTTHPPRPPLARAETARWSRAIRTVGRVLFVNREILTTSLALVSLTILLTSTLLHAACDDDAECVRTHGLTDLPSSMYVAVMMLTGQASPEGALSPAMRAVVLLTAFLSVPFFAVPAAMLTWGFEGEAQRLVERQLRHERRKRLYRDSASAALQLDPQSGADAGATADVDEDWSSSGSDSDSDSDEDYKSTIGGDDEDEDERDAAGVAALGFFVSAADGTATRGTRSMLLPAHQLAEKLRRRSEAAARVKLRQRDALDLLEKLLSETEHGISSEQAERLEKRLRDFSLMAQRDNRVLSQVAGSWQRLCEEGGDSRPQTIPEAAPLRADESGGSDQTVAPLPNNVVGQQVLGVEREVLRVGRDVAELRESVDRRIDAVARGMDEVKASVAGVCDVLARLQSPASPTGSSRAAAPAASPAAAPAAAGPLRRKSSFAIPSFSKKRSDA